MFITLGFAALSTIATSSIGIGSVIGGVGAVATLTTVATSVSTAGTGSIVAGSTTAALKAAHTINTGSNVAKVAKTTSAVAKSADKLSKATTMSQIAATTEKLSKTGGSVASALKATEMSKKAMKANRYMEIIKRGIKLREEDEKIRELLDAIQSGCDVVRTVKEMIDDDSNDAYIECFDEQTSVNSATYNGYNDAVMDIYDMIQRYGKEQTLELLEHQIENVMKTNKQPEEKRRESL